MDLNASGPLKSQLLQKRGGEVYPQTPGAFEYSLLLEPVQ